MVTAVAYTNFRKDLKSYLRRVNDDADMLLITNKDPRDNVVVMSADASAEVRHVGEQDRVANEFELPTNDYTLVNAALAVRPFTQQNVTLFAEARNLTNEEAREHASFLKDIAPLPGRNLRVGVAYRF